MDEDFTTRGKIVTRSRKYVEPTMEELRAEASKHQTKMEFNRASPKLYRYAWSKGLLDELCAHMFDARKEWTREKLEAEASKYTSKDEFRKQSNKAYQAAKYYGLVEEICKHMSGPKGSDYDTIYIGLFPETGHYKVGCTSSRLGFNRPHYLNKTLGMQILMMVKVIESGAALEQALLRIGTVPENAEHSEVRIWNEENRKKALQLIFENCYI
jgi:hypothetical protein